MANWYAGYNGDDGDDGMTWKTRKSTIGGLLGVTYAAGDRLYVGPGVYRERVTPTIGGATVTTRGTISVTNGSKIVTGTNTDWKPRVQAGDRLFIPWLAYGLTADGTGGVGNGAGGYQSVGAEFDPEIVGFCINIQGVGSYLIATRVDVSNITLTDRNGIGAWPGAGPQNFWVPSNEGSYEIESVDTDEQITLTRPWSGPTYTWTNNRYNGRKGGKGYEIVRPVYLIGNEDGAHTDGIGGVVRITGSDDDTAANDARCIDLDGVDYWVIKGFQLDTVTSVCLRISDAEHVTVEDCRMLNMASNGVLIRSDSDYITIRRCAMFGGSSANGIELDGNGIRWNDAIHMENLYLGTYDGVEYVDYANVTMKNCSNGMAGYRFVNATGALDAGACIFVHDCEAHYCYSVGITANAKGQVVENRNNYWGNAANINANVSGGPPVSPDSTTYLYIPEGHILLDGYRYPARFFPPSEWWACRGIQGLYQANEDIYGVPRPSTATKMSRGPQQEYHVERSTSVVYGAEEASLMHPDARRTQFRVPINGNPVTVMVYVYLGVNYAGTVPKLVVWQPGGSEVEVSATGTLEAWEQLSVSYTPNSQPLVLWIELVSDNTASAVNDDVYWQQVQVEEA